MLDPVLKPLLALIVAKQKEEWGEVSRWREGESMLYQRVFGQADINRGRHPPRVDRHGVASK